MEEGQSLLKVNGRELLFPPADLTMGEMCDAETYFSVDFNDPARSGMRLLAALLYVAIQRVDATVTPADVRALDPAILEQLAGSDADPPPTSEVGEPSSSSADDSPPPSTENSDNGHSPTGGPGSDTTSVSDPATWAS